MTQTNRLMVYSAMNEDQVLRRFRADAVQAEREGWVPMTQSWDGPTLTVTYGRVRTTGALPTEVVAPDGPAKVSLGTKLRRRLIPAFGS